MTKSASRRARRAAAQVPPDPKLERRRVAFVFGLTLLLGALAAFLVQPKSQPRASQFQLIDTTGGDNARGFELPDQNGVMRTLKDFKGEVVMVFFGFMHCPATMTEIVRAKKLMGVDGGKLRAVFVTVDPLRDTPDELKTYMANFDPGFVALRPTPDELKRMAAEFKLHIKQHPGASPTSYTMDHTAAGFMYDPQGRLRLYARYGAGAAALATDAKLLPGGA